VRPRPRPSGHTVPWPRALALAVAVALSLAGCAPDALATPTTSPTVTATATPVVTLPADLCANTGVDCPLDPGVYLAQQFEPPIGFTLDAGWTNEAYVERAIQLIRGSVDQPTESVSLVSGQLDGPTGTASAAGATAADFLAYLGTLSGVTVGAKAALTVGGLPATQVDVHVGAANATLFDQPIASTTEDPFQLRARETARLVVVDVGTARVVFVIEVFGSATLAGFLQAEVTPLLASVSFPPGA